MKLRIITEEKRGRYYVKPQKLVDEKWEDLKEGTKSVAAARLHGNEIRSLSSTKIARVTNRVQKWLETWKKDNKIKAEIVTVTPAAREPEEEVLKKSMMRCIGCGRRLRPIERLRRPFKKLCTNCQVAIEVKAREEQERLENAVLEGEIHGKQGDAALL
jgi:hypothetical protein